MRNEPRSIQLLNKPGFPLYKQIYRLLLFVIAPSLGMALFNGRAEHSPITDDKNLAICHSLSSPPFQIDVPMPFLVIARQPERNVLLITTIGAPHDRQR